MKCTVLTLLNMEKLLMVNQTVLYHTLLWFKEQCDVISLVINYTSCVDTRIRCSSDFIIYIYAVLQFHSL